MALDVHLYSHTWAEYKDPMENFTVCKNSGLGLGNAKRSKNEVRIQAGEIFYKKPDMYLILITRRTLKG